MCVFITCQDKPQTDIIKLKNLKKMKKLFLTAVLLISASIMSYADNPSVPYGSQGAKCNDGTYNGRVETRNYGQDRVSGSSTGSGTSANTGGSVEGNAFILKSTVNGGSSSQSNSSSSVSTTKYESGSGTVCHTENGEDKRFYDDGWK